MSQPRSPENQSILIRIYYSVCKTPIYLYSYIYLLCMFLFIHGGTCLFLGQSQRPRSKSVASKLFKALTDNIT